MENKKMVETIEKKLGVTVEEVKDVVIEGKDITVDVRVGATECRKVVLREMKNQYGAYYKIVSESQYELEEVKEEVEEEIVVEAEKKAAISLKTKTEKLCGVRRKDIINYAQKTISSLVDGSATLKEIEGPANEDTAIRFVLIMNADGSRFKEDLAISQIRANAI